jgi:outer membrane protein TolC
MRNLGLIIFLFVFISGFSQEKVMKFSLDDVITLAKEQSPDAVLARNRFKANYWQYRSFKADYLPSMNFSGTVPNINRSLKWNDATNSILETNSLINYGQISLNQNVGLTGGNIAVSSNLQQTNKMGSESSTKFISSPISVSFNQPIFGYNSMRWERKIQPLVFEEAKKNFIDAQEQIAIRAASRFFDLAQAQLNLRIAQINLSNSDTLFKISKGRYNIGTIAQNDLLQMQLSYLNAKTSLKQAELDLETSKSKLRSFLGYNEKMTFDLILPDTVPVMIIDYDRVMQLALKNNSNVVAWQRRMFEAQRDLAQAQGQRRQINLYASYGLDHGEADKMPDVYKPTFNDMQQLRLGVNVPILDWGKGKGRVKMAESNKQLAEVQINQEKVDFEQNVFVQVMQFNMQGDMLAIAAKSDTIAQSRYDVTKQRFLIGRIDVLNLNDALKEKDSAKRGYINALRSFWSGFYSLRSLTLFDFITNKDLNEDFDKLID